jgi:hypothetical protein
VLEVELRIASELGIVVIVVDLVEILRACKNNKWQGGRVERKGKWKE